MTAAADRTVYRYEAPVDDRWHTLTLSGPIVHVDSRRSGLVEVWAYANTHPAADRCFKVFGTGWPLPPAAGAHVGTVLDGGFVWHLIEHADPVGD